MNFRIFRIARPAVVAVLFFCIGCSSGTGSAISPESGLTARMDASSHASWGMWQFTADPVAQSLDVVQLRTSDLHLNALPFLEPPPLVFLTLETLHFNGDIIDADIGLRHPFLGLTEFTGFDVCGILISSGSVSGYSDTGIVMTGSDETYLLNPDGFTRWWNPAEFPSNGTIFSYTDGMLGTPNGVASFNSTVNAYKFYCDDLTDPDIGLDILDPGNRCVFSAGHKNIRHYTIHIGEDGLVFNYAVDASWMYPQGSPPYEAPDDFPPGANRPEAWNISVSEIQNTLYNDGEESGGELSILVDVWDHYNAGLNAVWLDSPGNFDFTESDIPVDGGAGYSTYQLDVTGATPSPDSIKILIGVECESDGYQGLLPGKTVTAYFTYEADVSDEPYVDTCDFGSENFQITDSYLGDGFTNYFTAGGIQLTRQSDEEYFFIRGVHDENYNHIYAFATSNPNSGPADMFDNGEGYGFNSSKSFVVDGYSEPGIDRIFYQSGAGVANHLKYVDWNGTGFTNNQDLGQPDSYGIWKLALTPEGDFYLFTSHYLNPRFYFYDKSAGYAKTFMFALDPSDFGYGETQYIMEMIYDPELDALVFFCKNPSVSGNGQIFVMEPDGDIIFEDTDLFETPVSMSYGGGMYIDLDEPECRILIHCTVGNQMYFVRYSSDFLEKRVYSQPGPSVGYGFCRGDIANDGTMWASWDYITWFTYIFKLDPPSDW